MKWIALLLFILIGMGFAIAVRRDRRAVVAAAFLLGFLPFVISPWNLLVAPYSFAGWPGYVQGWEVGLIDAIAVACLIGIPNKYAGLPFKYVFLFYISSVVISVLFAPNLSIAVSYPIQLARIFVVFTAVARITSSPIGPKAVLQGLFVGLAYQAVVALWAKLGGAIQTGGSFGHQNLLGFASHMVFMPALGLLLSGRWTRWALLGLACGTIVITTTASRGTLLFAAIGLSTTYLLSATSQWSSRKGIVGLAAIAAVGLSLPIVLASFEQRFEQRGDNFTAEDQERLAFKRAARMMIADAPFGVGANHYVLVANMEGYSQRAGVAWNSTSRATNVHNTYLLVWAETGFLGIISLVVLFTTALASSLVWAFKDKRPLQSNLLFGITGGIFAVILHSFFEWIFVTFSVQYVFAISLGLASGLSRQTISDGVLRPRGSIRSRGVPKNAIVAQ